MRMTSVSTRARFSQSCRSPSRQWPVTTANEVELCRITFQRPVADCPRYVEYFKTGDELPKGRCELHRGSFADRAGRAFGRLLGRIGRRLKRILD